MMSQIILKLNWLQNKANYICDEFGPVNLA